MRSHVAGSITDEGNMYATWRKVTNQVIVWNACMELKKEKKKPIEDYSLFYHIFFMH